MNCQQSRPHGILNVRNIFFTISTSEGIFIKVIAMLFLPDNLIPGTWLL